MPESGINLNIVREDDIREGQLKTGQFLAGSYNLVTEKNRGLDKFPLTLCFSSTPG